MQEPSQIIITEYKVHIHKYVGAIALLEPVFSEVRLIKGIYLTGKDQKFCSCGLF